MIAFNGTNEVYGAFSNAYDCPEGVRYNGTLYGNVEAAIQAQKTTNFEERLKFRKESALAARKHGKRIKVRDDWDFIKASVLEEAIYCKFSQDTELKELLLRTGNEELEYDTSSRHDNEMGYCHCGRCKNKEHKNKLGKVLMEVREKLRNECE